MEVVRGVVGGSAGGGHYGGGWLGWGGGRRSGRGAREGGGGWEGATGGGQWGGRLGGWGGCGVRSVRASRAEEGPLVMWLGDGEVIECGGSAGARRWGGDAEAHTVGRDGLGRVETTGGDGEEIGGGGGVAALG